MIYDLFLPFFFSPPLPLRGKGHPSRRHEYTLWSRRRSQLIKEDPKFHSPSFFLSLFLFFSLSSREELLIPFWIYKKFQAGTNPALFTPSFFLSPFFFPFRRK